MPIMLWILILTFFIRYAATDLAYAARGVETPRHKQRMEEIRSGTRAPSRSRQPITDRTAARQFFAHVWHDAWDDAHEARTRWHQNRKARRAAKEGKADRAATVEDTTTVEPEPQQPDEAVPAQDLTAPDMTTEPTNRDADQPVTDDLDAGEPTEVGSSPTPDSTIEIPEAIGGSVADDDTPPPQWSGHPTGTIDHTSATTDQFAEGVRIYRQRMAARAAQGMPERTRPRTTDLSRQGTTAEDIADFCEESAAVNGVPVTHYAVLRERIDGDTPLISTHLMFQGAASLRRLHAEFPDVDPEDVEIEAFAEDPDAEAVARELSWSKYRVTPMEAPSDKATPEFRAPSLATVTPINRTNQEGNAVSNPQSVNTGGGETTNLSQALNFSAGMQKVAASCVAEIEQSIANLQAKNVTGEPITVLAQMAEAFGNAAGSATTAHQLFTDQTSVKEAHMAVSHAGDKDYLLGE